MRTSQCLGGLNLGDYAPGRVKKFPSFRSSLGVTKNNVYQEKRYWEDYQSHSMLFSWADLCPTVFHMSSRVRGMTILNEQ